MQHLKRLGNQVSIPFPLDKDGYLGRECPKCERYFKITPGTGITDGKPLCHCPHCGHSAPQDHFLTQDQIAYARSVANNSVTDAFIKDLKSLNRTIRPKGPFGIGLSIKASGSPTPIRPYEELTLEEEIVCDNCTLRYTVYGSFAFCPDCGHHNSRQILEKYLCLVQKQLDFASKADGNLADRLIASALADAVSACDGFGRETCRVHAAKASDPTRVEKISFQNLVGAQKNLQILFGIDLCAAMDAQDWSFTCRCFKKRNLFAHAMGIIDDAYVKATGDPTAVVGRKTSIQAQDIVSLLGHIRRLGSFLATELEKKP